MDIYSTFLNAYSNSGQYVSPYSKLTNTSECTPPSSGSPSDERDTYEPTSFMGRALSSDMTTTYAVSTPMRSVSEKLQDTMQELELPGIAQRMNMHTQNGQWSPFTQMADLYSMMADQAIAERNAISPEEVTYGATANSIIDQILAENAQKDVGDNTPAKDLYTSVDEASDIHTGASVDLASVGENQVSSSEQVEADEALNYVHFSGDFLSDILDDKKPNENE